MAGKLLTEISCNVSKIHEPDRLDRQIKNVIGEIIRRSGMNFDYNASLKQKVGSDKLTIEVEYKALVHQTEL